VVDRPSIARQSSFNPVLGFLSVSTLDLVGIEVVEVGFNPVLGFLSVSTDDDLDHEGINRVSIPCWVF